MNLLAVDDGDEVVGTGGVLPEAVQACVPFRIANK